MRENSQEVHSTHSVIAPNVYQGCSMCQALFEMLGEVHEWKHLYISPEIM